jgi:transposase-like protein
MNPQDMFCPHRDCPSHRQPGADHIVSHGRRRARFKCRRCGRTFGARKGTPYYRLHTPEETVTCAVTLLAHGCPPQAIVAAFRVDERTVAAWQRRAGQHGAAVQRAFLEPGRVDLEHVQADELWVKVVGRKLWLAHALAVPSRLWLGGVLGTTRDRALIRDLVAQVRRCARQLGILVCVDGLPSYVTAFCRAFKETVRTGRRGGQPKRLPAGFLLGQVIKSAVRCRVVAVAHRAVIGTLDAIEARVKASRGGQGLNTAFIERLNATFRSRLVPLVRRGRYLARQERTLHAGMYLVGTVYNFCCFHRSLRQPGSTGSGRKWAERTPAMAAGLTDHRWSVDELLHFRVRPHPLDLDKWRGQQRRGAVRRAHAPPLQERCLSTV